MPDDVDDKLPDPAQVVMPDAPSREPRTAVDAAGDPAHGGGQPAFTEVEIPSQGTMRMALNPMTQDTSRLVGSFGDFQAKDHPRADAPPRTILSGVARLDMLKKRAAAMLHEAEQFVRGMEGVQPVDAMEWEWSKSPDTAGHIHDAVFDMEGLFDKLADVMRRAKAAHG